MEAWMVSILIVGFIVMISWWGLLAWGKKLQQRRKQEQPDYQYRYMHRDEYDNGRTYDSNGSPIK